MLYILLGFGLAILMVSLIIYFQEEDSKIRWFWEIAPPTFIAILFSMVFSTLTVTKTVDCEYRPITYEQIDLIDKKIERKQSPISEPQVLMRSYQKISLWTFHTNPTIYVEPEKVFIPNANPNTK